MRKSIKVLSGVALAAMMTVVSMGYGPGNNAFRLKTALASSGTVECDCAFWGGNDNCLANNYGAVCAADGTTQCQAFNANCGGKNQPVTPTPAPQP